MEEFHKNFNLKAIKISPYAQKVKKPWGYELIWTDSDSSYVGKLLFIKKGHRLSLQYHDQKDETQLLLSGKVTRINDDNDGKLVEFNMKKNTGYRIVPGQRHRLVVWEDSMIVEVSTLEQGTTFRLDDDYKRSNETENLRKQPNRGWS